MHPESWDLRLVIQLGNVSDPFRIYPLKGQQRAVQLQCGNAFEQHIPGGTVEHLKLSMASAQKALCLQRL